MSVEVWKSQAACRGLDTALFFPLGGESGTEAKAVCAGCPVRTECLDYQLAAPEAGDTGIWGGTSARQRRKMRRQRTAYVAYVDTTAMRTRRKAAGLTQADLSDMIGLTANAVSRIEATGRTSIYTLNKLTKILGNGIATTQSQSGAAT